MDRATSVSEPRRVSDLQTAAGLAFLKSGHCYFQNRPLGMETGQYPRVLCVAKLSREF
jgi:hypothetical protein